MQERNSLEPAIELLADCVDILGQRNEVYGEPQDLYRRVAAIHTAFFNDTYHPADACLEMVIHKLGRIKVDPLHKDNYADAINYLALAWHLRQPRPAPKG